MKQLPSSPGRTIRKPLQTNDVNGCDHTQRSNYQKLDIGSFFTTNYYKKNQHAPRCCHFCSKEFGLDYKVGSRNPVYACYNSQNKNHSCVHAYCNDCFNSWATANTNTESNSQNNKRIRRGIEVFDV